MSLRTASRWFILFLVVLFLAAGFVIAAPASAGEIAIPESSALYRIKLERETARYFGLNAPVARLAAQIHQESGWRPKAQSPYAQGLAQFTPATAKWLPSVCPETGEPDPWNPTWSLGAIACYDAWLYERVKPMAWGDMHRSVDTSPSGFNLKPGQMTECARWHFTLRAYNGGEGWLNKERRAAAQQGWNPNRWDEVEHVRLRAGWAHKENTRYPIRILMITERYYVKAGWPGATVC